MSDSLQPHGFQHTKLPCPLPSPRVCSNSCPLGRWCHPTTSSSAAAFSFCFPSFLASGSFSSESALHIRWSMCCSFSFSISPSDEHSQWISFRIDSFDLLLLFSGNIWGSVLQRVENTICHFIRLSFHPLIQNVYWLPAKCQTHCAKEPQFEDELNMGGPLDSSISSKDISLPKPCHMGNTQ